MDKYTTEKQNELLRFALEQGELKTSETDGEDYLSLSVADRWKLAQGEVEVYGYPLSDEDFPVIEIEMREEGR